MTNDSTTPTGPGSGQPGGPTPGQQQNGSGLDGFFEMLRRPGIHRPASDRWFAGVANGIATRLGVDALVVRAGFILLSLFFGIGVALYLVLWTLMPDDKNDIMLEKALKHGDGSAIFLLVVTAMSVLGAGPWSGDGAPVGRLIGYLVIAVVAWWFFTRTNSGRDLFSTVKTQVGQNQDQGDWTQATNWTRTGDPSGGMSTGNAAANRGAAPFAPTGPTGQPTSVVRTRTIGFFGGVLLLGLSILTGLLGHQVALARGISPDQTVVVVAIASGLAVLGLGLVVVGFAGRRSGWLSPVAIVGIVTVVAAAIMPANLAGRWDIGELNAAPVSVSTGDTFVMTVGDLTLDLTGTTPPTAPTSIETSVGLGDLTIIVPKGLPVLVEASVKAGDIRSEGNNGDPISRSGGNTTAKFTFGDPASDSVLHIKAAVALGQITVREGVPSTTGQGATR